MCGIAGFLSQSPLDGSAEARVHAMTGAIAHRGPDDSGSWIDADAGIALGHRRLAIIDLSAAGHQPMTSADGRLVITYNGEIYNFAEISAELEASGLAPAWRGRSDTEVLLAAISAWGIERALTRTKGMFAFGLWDRKDRTLTLARDRMGEKPLYYGWQGGGSNRRLLFGSDVSALQAHPAFANEIDTDAIALLARYLYIPEPYSAYRGIQKVMPGCFVVVNAASGNMAATGYWDTLKVAAEARANPFRGSAEDAVDQLGAVLGAAVKRQMVSDVSLGAFLSGGVDSSTIVSLMQAQSSRPVKTFTVGFEEKAYDESSHARAVAEHLGTEHNELLVTAADAQAVIPDLPRLFSEPFADSSQLPTLLLSRLARSQVTVSLSGDAGDELFAGYNRHYYAQRYWGGLSRIPTPVRAGLAKAMTVLSPRAWDNSVGQLVKSRISHFGEEVHKTASVLSSRSVDELYSKLISINLNSAALLAQPGKYEAFAGHDLTSIAHLDPIERMMALDSIHYLPGDVLVKVDRAAMAVSLEGRIPMLDPDVVSFAWSLPIDYKIRDGVGKWPLRALLYRHVPRALIERPKMGFGVPVGTWLRGSLRDWGEAMLDRQALASGGLFDPAGVRKMWDEHQSGARNHQHRLWPVLMTQAWLMSKPPAAAQ